MVAALLLVLAAAAALYVGVLRTPAKPRPGSLASNKPKAAATPTPSPTPTLGPFGHIGTRADDPQPLTVAQLYPLSFYAPGGSVVRTADRIGTNCGAAIAGSNLQGALSSAGCTQAVRATYLQAKRDLMGTIGVLNLRSGNAAKVAARSAGAANFIAQVPGRKGPTTKIGQGTGIEDAYAKGHYLILIWAEFTDLHRPANAKQRTDLAQFMTQLLDKTANVSLTTRMLTGLP